MERKTNGVVAEAAWAKPSRTIEKIQRWRLRYGKRFDFPLNLSRNVLDKSHMKEIFLEKPDAVNYTIENLGESVFFILFLNIAIHVLISSYCSQMRDMSTNSDCLVATMLVVVRKQWNT